MSADTVRTTSPLHPPSRCVIASVPIDCITLHDAAARIVHSLKQRPTAGPFLIMGPNAQLVTLAQKNERFAQALQASALNLPDGISVVLASKILGRRIPARVTGGDLMVRLCVEASRHGLSVFFLGGLPGAAAQAASTLQRHYPALQVAGAYCPPFGFEHDSMENAHIRGLIREAAPDILFVALGAPKQEIWMHENCSTLPIGAALSVGAAFDTQAGLRKRAPQWTHRIGAEWLYRLIQEPRRLWRRYLLGNTYFLFLVFKQVFNQRLLDGQLPDHQGRWTQYSEKLAAAPPPVSQAQTAPLVSWETGPQA